MKNIFELSVSVFLFNFQHNCATSSPDLASLRLHVATHFLPADLKKVNVKQYVKQWRRSPALGCKQLRRPFHVVCAV